MEISAPFCVDAIGPISTGRWGGPDGIPMRRIDRTTGYGASRDFQGQFTQLLTPSENSPMMSASWWSVPWTIAYGR
jgi:hypothetical protein